MNPKNLSFLFAMCVSLLGAVSAYAADYGSEPQKRVVTYADLNVSTQQGAAALYRRIRAAANEVCRTGANVRALAELTRSKACSDHAIAEAVSTVGNPKLIQLHLEHSGVHQELIARVSH